MYRVLATGFVCLLLLHAGPSSAGDAEIRAAQATIDGQLKAFQRNDGAAAYDYAAPSIRQMFPSVDIFMSMVTNGYAPVRNPKAFSFGKVEEQGDVVMQQVLITGPDGKDYEALYRLQRQPDGSYKITGVSLKASNALST